MLPCFSERTLRSFPVEIREVLSEGTSVGFSERTGGFFLKELLEDSQKEPMEDSRMEVVGYSQNNNKKLISRRNCKTDELQKKVLQKSQNFFWNYTRNSWRDTGTKSRMIS